MKKSYILNKFCILFLIWSFLLPSFNAYATEGDSSDSKEAKKEDSSSNSSADSEAFKTTLQQFLGSSPTANDIATWSFLISTLKSDGLGDNAIAGLMSNVSSESNGYAYAIEGYSISSYSGFREGNTYNLNKPSNAESYHNVKPGRGSFGAGHGIVQWSFDRAQNLSSFAERNKDKFGYAKITHYGVWKQRGTITQITANVPNRAGQCCFIMEELRTVFKNVREQVNAAGSAKDAAAIIYDKYEIGPAEYRARHLARADKALKCVQACTGVQGTYAASTNENGEALDENGDVITDENGEPITDANTEVSASDIGSVSDYMSTEGYWSVEELSNYNHLIEDYIDISGSIDDMTQDERNSLVIWQSNIDFMNSQNGVWHWMLYFFMVIGIGCILFGICYYMLYWFDKSFLLGQAVEGGLMGLLTSLLPFTKKHIVAYDDNDPERYLDGPDTRVVTHKRALITAVLAILLGVLICSGLIFKLIAKLIIFLYTGVKVICAIFGLGN